MSEKIRIKLLKNLYRQTNGIVYYDVDLDTVTRGLKLDSQELLSILHILNEDGLIMYDYLGDDTISITDKGVKKVEMLKHKWKSIISSHQTLIGTLITAIVAIGIAIFTTKQSGENLIQKNIKGNNIMVKGSKNVNINNYYQRFPKTKVPNINYELKTLDEDYIDGLAVYGIKWQSGYKAYEIIISNNSKEAFADNIRCKIELPGGLVHQKILSSHGINNINTSSGNDFIRKIQPVSNKAEEIIPYITNILSLSASQIYPMGLLDIILIVNMANNNGNGIFNISYSYNDSQTGKSITIEKSNPIEVNKGTLSINTNINIDKNISHTFSLEFNK